MPLPDLVRNLPITASLLRSHGGRGRAKAQSVLLRRLPAGVTRRLATGVVVARRPDLAALAMAASGDTEGGVRTLREALAAAPGGTPAPPAHRRRVAEAAVTLHRPDLAEQALDGIPAGEQEPALAALVAAGRGRLGAALLLAATGADAGSRRLARRLCGEVETVRAELLGECLQRPAAPRRRVGRPQRVLHVVSTALPERQGGYTIRTHGIATAQRAHGIDARVVTRLGFPVDTGVLGAASDVRVDGVPYHRLLPAAAIPAPGRARQQLAVRELGRVIEQAGTELLHAHSWHENAQVALLAARPLGLPLVYEARGFLEETWRTDGGPADSDYYRWSRDTETLCMSSADVVVTLAEAMRQDVVDRGIDASSVVVVPNAVPAAFTAPLPDGRPLRERLGIAADDFVLGTVTTVNHYEGLDTVVEALRLVEDPTFSLLVVGSGPALPGLRALVEQAGLADRVRFTGRVPHARVREHLAAMDLFVVPRHETPVTVLVPPIKPLEAMAGGLPVLASALPPLVEIVRPGSFGDVAAAGDAASWADQIASLGYAPDQVRALGERAREFVARERTWPPAVDRYDVAYASAGAR